MEGRGAHALSTNITNFHYGWNLILFNKIDMRMRIVQLPARPFRAIRLDGRGCYLERSREVDLKTGVARSACNGERGEA